RCRRRRDARPASARGRRRHRSAGIVRAQWNRGPVERIGLPKHPGAGRGVRRPGPLVVPDRRLSQLRERIDLRSRGLRARSARSSGGGKRADLLLPAAGRRGDRRLSGGSAPSGAVVESPAMSATAERRAWILGTTAPALVFLLVIAYLPIGYAVALSFFKKTAFNPAMTWVGLENYRYILNEPELWSAFGRSVVFTVGSVGLQVVMGLGSALLLNRAFAGSTVVRSLFVLPYLVPSIVVALVFQWLLSQEYGVIN